MTSRADTQGRAHSTAIYYLLARGDRSQWHRIDAVEIWHYYSGAALTLQIANDGCAPHIVTLGPDVAAGERPQAIVPAGAWQAAETTGDWTLVGCTVAPGFEFAGFEMAEGRLASGDLTTSQSEIGWVARHARH